MFVSHLSSFSADCKSIGCDKCCFYGEGKGAPVPKTEADSLGLAVEPGADGMTLLLQKESDRGMCCAHLGDDGCTVWDKRPFVCRYWPAMLYKGEVVLSVKCPYVYRTFLSRIDGQDGFTPDDIEMFSRLRDSMRAEIPKELEELWNHDISKWPIVVKIRI